MPQKYLIHRHHARHLHYDLRLEMDGVLKSWAIPKEPSMDPKVKRLAIQVEDHPLEYGDFEGEIPEGHYGAGRVEIWDSGEYDLINRKDWKLIIDIHGQRLKGKFVLVKIKPKDKEKDNNWLFFKKKED